jgi:peptide chain release factor 1
MDFEPLIDKKKERLEELEAIMSAEDFYSDPKQAAEISKEYNYIKKLLENWDLFANSRRQLKDNYELVKGDDEEMTALAQEEIPELESACEKLELQIQYLLLPQDKTEDRDAIVEIRAGTGGDEASLFAGDLYRMYQRFSELSGWKLEPLESSQLKYESGVHRVQRVPETETQGRIHTSTATVAVMPEAEAVDIDLKPDELNIQATRSGGPGGQHVNTTDSCIQVTHLPTGIMVRCQDGRSQTKNKEKALTILRSKLLEAKQREEGEKYSEQRRNLIGSGGREEKIRTYNFPQNRVTDHRIGLTLHNLEGVLAGQVEELVEALQSSELAERLQEAGLK